MSGSAKVKIEEITKEEAKKVYLIIAKGKKSIYLMPAVLSEESDAGNNLKATEREKEIWTNGVDVASWKWNDRQAKEWDVGRDGEIQKSLKGGFIVARAGGNVVNGVIEKNESERLREFEYWWGGKISGMRAHVRIEQHAEGDFYYQNAGIVLGKRGEKEVNLGLGLALVVEQFNNTREKFFPLDIQVMGENQSLKDKHKDNKRLVQEIEIDDEITQVVGVRLDQVVISETGIGGGVEREIKWGNLKRPTWTSELIK
ncbi:hypothetical protein WEN_02440 [Mycoplasma wenyonii str. Massachusetts]|uniref:Uncharacterized protein n=1 Tax=Mycoplasma wenyonii (strain Massachusetts) TaxID=1197325 RepID=I6ZJB4_MYCWM|nr:hypothetical protein [Mycoplasma wenyonii]AFN65275.1 hypothetical protein WEN_02440 [Mycoplasma wenyonii str. Massachusetts]